ncbi:TPA: NADPH-dependent 7-cyano-7-deazaguanine reductase QueF [Candidatus Gastranaerophilales bacterium HUM_20]|nr:gTP cyclohydrolase I/Nitrile oxidoreductase [Clostridium sp. CAG:729]DAB18515.1 MAG TPA: NADPH-dependent 7-cyano-7-deazaguanine reductase QueF [Candidatus Gastranaerophilales bacterium HUM_20]
MSDKTNQIASTLLGKKVSYSDEYNPSLLVAVPRYDNRKQYNIQNDNLPFEGWDVWHAYEFSSMSENGVPVTRLMKLKYNCTSEFIIESKSLKLYLNSFNMTRYGKSIKECLEICKNIIEKDLSEKLQTDVTVNFIEENAERVQIFNDFNNLMDYIDESTLKIEKFKESPELIEVEQSKKTEGHFLMFDSLRSNCRVTHQPDFGDVFIYYKSSKHIKENSLVKYLSSFRSEYHFHEECCEMIYKRLYDLLDRDDELFVCALYTRRGGIDICPSRRSKNCNIVDVFKLTDTSIYARKSIKQ